MNVLDVFSDANIRDYYRTLPEEPMLGSLFFPDTAKIPEMSVEYIVGANRLPVIANIHAMDSETEIGSREGFSKREIELLKVAIKLQLKESDIRKLNQPRSDYEKNYVAEVLFNDVTRTRESVRTRIEAMRMEALSNGIINISGNNMTGTIDYQVPKDNQYLDPTNLPGKKPWSDPKADILGDLHTMSNELIKRGGDFTRRALTSKTILSYMLMNEKLRSAYYGVNSDMLMTPAKLNDLLSSQDLPTIATYDKYYRTSPTQSTRFFPEEKFVMMPDVALGETVYGVTAEELATVDGVQYSETDNIITMVYNTGPDPVGTWTKSCTIAIPTFPEAGNVIQAKVI